MQASDNKIEIPTWAKIAYLFLFAILALIAYRIGSIWFGHIVVILLTIPLIWFAGPKSRRVVFFSWLVFSLTLLLSTGMILFFDQRTDAIDSSRLLSFFLGGTGARALVSITMALLISLTIVMIPILIIAYISSEWILNMPGIYDITRRQAMRLLLSMILNTSYPYYIIEDGELTLSKPGGVLPGLGGPGVAVVKPYNAVVFERSGNVTRVEGPGMFMTKRFEFIKTVINLRKQWENITPERVLTKDNVPLTFELGVGYRIEAGRDTARRVAEGKDLAEGGKFTGIISGEYAVYKWTIYRAVYNVTGAGWKLTTQGAAETQLRKVMREYSLADLYQYEGGQLVPDASMIGKIEAEVKKRLEAITPSWGTAITGVVLKTFEAPENVTDRLLEMWAARYAGRTQIIGAEGERDAVLTRLQAEEKVKLRIAVAERDADWTKLEADRKRITRIAEADRDAELIRLEAEEQRIIQIADAEHIAQEKHVEGEKYGLLERGKAESELIVTKAEAEQKATLKEAEAEKEAAALKAEARKAQADAEKAYISAVGAAEAQARAAMFQAILTTLAGMSKDAQERIAQDLSTRVGLYDAIDYLAAVTAGERRKMLPDGHTPKDKDTAT